MRQQPISTPFGKYRSVATCARAIVRWNPEGFISEQAVLGYFSRGDEVFDRVYRVVHQLLQDKNKPEWCRLPVGIETDDPEIVAAVAAPEPVAADPAPVATPASTVMLVSLADLAKFGHVFVGHTVKITA